MVLGLIWDDKVLAGGAAVTQACFAVLQDLNKVERNFSWGWLLGELSVEGLVDGLFDLAF